MDFFCTKCKRKHKADKIGFNLWDICAEQVASNLESISDELFGDEDRDLAEIIAKWCRDPNTKRAFVFVGDDLINQICMDNEPNSQCVVRGHFRLTLQWLLDEYWKATYDPSVYEFSVELPKLPIYNCYMKVTYEMAGGERVLSSIQDENDDPFTGDDGVKHGFQRCCPEGHPLSQAVGKAKEYVIALSGSPRAGKTSCITAIMRALRDGLYQRDFELSMDPFNDDPQWKKLSGEIDLFRDGWSINKTGIDETELTYSILVRVGNNKRVLTFVDMPGEFWQMDGTGFSPEWYTQYAGIYENLDCIWFFISKWTAYGTAATNLEAHLLSELENVTAETVAQVKNGDAANLKANLGQLSAQLAAEGKQMPPIAVVLTKGDVPITQEDWKDAKKYGLFPISDDALAMPSVVSTENNQELKSLLVRSDRGDCLLLNEYEYWRRAHKAREFFRNVNSGALSEAIEQNFARKTYISMAAYGHPSTKKCENVDVSNETPLPPTPYHEMLPLLWTFAVLGALQVKHPCEWYRETIVRTSKFVRKRELEVGFSYRKLDRLLLKRTKAEADKKYRKTLKDEGFFDELQNMEDIGKNLLQATNELGQDSYTVTKLKSKCMGR